MIPDPSKTAAITGLQSLKNTTQVKSFLQMCQYNSMSTFGNQETYSDITAPLRTLLRKDTVFHWTVQCDTAVSKLKEALVSEQVMAHWATDCPTELVVDRWPEGIPATLYHQDPQTKQWRIINYNDRALTPVEQRYSPAEGESLAILYGVSINCMYMLWPQFHGG